KKVPKKSWDALGRPDGTTWRHKKTVNMLHDKKISKSSVKTHGIVTEPLTEAEKLTLLRNYDDRDPANKYLSRAWLRKKREYLIRNWDRLRKPKEPISFRERIERYMDACPAAISGQNGHDQT